MDPLLVVIVLALAGTAATLLLGLLSMSSGGTTNQLVSTPLMWARIGFQGFTLILLIAAVLLHNG